jgi:hypothetical protein
MAGSAGEPPRQNTPPARPPVTALLKPRNRPATTPRRPRNSAKPRDPPRRQKVPTFCAALGGTRSRLLASCVSKICIFAFHKYAESACPRKDEHNGERRHRGQRRHRKPQSGHTPPSDARNTKREEWSAVRIAARATSSRRVSARINTAQFDVPMSRDAAHSRNWRSQRVGGRFARCNCDLPDPRGKETR